MRSLVLAPLLALTLLVAGCGGDDEAKVSAEEAKVIAAYNGANDALEAGDYAKVCTFYTVELVTQVIKDAKAKNCKEAFETIGRNLKKANPDPEVQKAILNYGPEEAKITGNRALAKFGKPPPVLKKAFPDAPDQGTVELRKTADGKWLIATFTVAG